MNVPADAYYPSEEGIGIATSIHEECDKNTIITEFSLHQIYPNPFNAGTRIDYQLNKTSKIKLTIHDMNGREVLTLINGERSAGKHSILSSLKILQVVFIFTSLALAI